MLGDPNQPPNRIAEWYSAGRDTVMRSLPMPERVLLWCLGRADIEWLVTPEIMNEYSSMIQRPKFGLSHATINWWLELLAADTQLIKIKVKIDFPRDRKDAPFLMCAAPGDADYLITGDGDFSEAQTLIATPILSVRAFAETVAPQTLIQTP